MGNPARRSIVLSIAFWTATAAGAAAQTNTGATEDAADLVATQVREQGYSCDDPTSARQESPEDDDAVWILTCQNASYRVRLVPDMAAHIKQLD